MPGPSQKKRKPFARGMRLTADDLNALLDNVVDNIKGGENVTVERVGSSVIVSAKGGYMRKAKSRWL